MIGVLPKGLEIAGALCEIRTDYRDCLTILQAFEDRELEDTEKYEVLLNILYVGDIPEGHMGEAIEKAVWFLDCGGTVQKPGQKKKIIDFKQDEQMLFSAINKVSGFETRAVDYLHFWTFMSFFNEIGEGLFSTVLGIRLKRSRGKKLEPYEHEFYRDNKELIDLKEQYTKKEKEEIAYFNDLFS